MAFASTGCRAMAGILLCALATVAVAAAASQEEEGRCAAAGDETSALLQVGRVDKNQKEDQKEEGNLWNFEKNLQSAALWKVAGVPNASDMMKEFAKMHKAMRSNNTKGWEIPQSKSALQALLAPFEAIFMQSWVQQFQINCMKLPKLLAKPLQMFAFIEGVLSLDASYMARMRKHFGDNFVFAGQVIQSNSKDLKTALTSPQLRTSMLGFVPLAHPSLPALDIQQREVLPITISQGVTGSWEAFRPPFDQYLLNDDAKARQEDATAKRLLQKLASDYMSMDHSKGHRLGGFPLPNKQPSFFLAAEGLQPFLIRYLHYVIFGLNPDDEETMSTLMELHYGLPCKNPELAKSQVKQYAKLPELPARKKATPSMKKVQKIYEGSPALKDFKGTTANWNMTRAEIADGAIALMALAGLQGTLHAARTAMGFSPLPNYPGNTGLPEMDLTTVWDGLNLTDRASLRSYAMECVRLDPPVISAAQVAPGRTTVVMSKSKAKHTFPKGAQLSIGISLGNVDEEVWGPTVLEFNASRADLKEHLFSFNSWGPQSAGRQCPGQEITLTMLEDVLRVVGEARRAASASSILPLKLGRAQLGEHYP